MFKLKQFTTEHFHRVCGVQAQCFTTAGRFDLTLTYIPEHGILVERDKGQKVISEIVPMHNVFTFTPEDIEEFRQVVLKKKPKSKRVPASEKPKRVPASKKIEITENMTPYQKVKAEKENLENAV